MGENMKCISCGNWLKITDQETLYREPWHCECELAAKDARIVELEEKYSDLDYLYAEMGKSLEEAREEISALRQGKAIPSSDPEISALNQKVERARECLEYFVRRVEEGTIRSKRTYRKFKDALAEMNS